MCRNCELKPVFVLQNNRKLCKSCFIKYFNKKVRKTIRVSHLIRKHEKVVVACSGGKDSLSILSMLKEISRDGKDFQITAVGVDEGTEYRKKTLANARRVCKALGIKFTVISFKKKYGKTLDEFIFRMKVKPCSLCGVLRRRMLNDYCAAVGADKLCTGHNMDDEAQAILMNQFRRNVDANARGGPITGVMTDKKFVRRIKPFYFMLEKETAIYAYLKGFFVKNEKCTYASISYRDKIKNMLNDFEEDCPGTKNSIIASFMQILPLLKKRFEGRRIGYCEECGEPASGGRCMVCRMTGNNNKHL